MPRLPVSTRRHATAAALLLALTACGGAVSSEGACEPIVEFDGRTYRGQGELPADVAIGTELGQGTVPPCNDTGDDAEQPYNVAVERAVGVDPGTALIFDGELYLAEGADALPTAAATP